jgi:superfamily II DNA helicase RecQ
MNDLYSLSESEVNSFFDDDGGGMEGGDGMGDITLSSIHGKDGIAMVILRELLSLSTLIDDSLSQEDIQTLLYGLASKNYGITSPYPFQLEAAEKAIRSCNTLVIQPTGKGKSLCYQLVALQSKKQVFVFTPTIALMHDQAKQLQSRGISAIVLGDAGGTIDDLCCYPSQPLIVYLTPEYIFGPSSARRLVVLKELAESGKISLIAIDEAHLLFEWEHFRY